ncbi:Prolyl 3-hydroxylase ogfod1 [Actinomortierella ambigua]|uniref:Prolyl 3-hydroxylase ogfod1 n=1 Tax=Actinomortierella ambigua TaxID=1343610 RepID=A0A9P6QJK6_9FUNG|nr:Prolyl 3-hydroxylase ogfod1 [Actinomortierella ambigua]
MAKHVLEHPQNSDAPLKRAKQEGAVAPTFNGRYGQADFSAEFFKAFHQRQSFHDAASDAKVYPDPYPAAVLPNFLESTEYLQKLREELLEEPYFHKSNDLYEFYQSEDLRLSKKPHIKAFKEAIYSQQFFAMMSALTGIDLDPSIIDLNGNQYHEGCYLLCHDDDIKNEKEGRRIAFILYLVDDDWSAADGGALDLFKCDTNGHPVEVVQSLVPSRNSLAFFELSPMSYHQVAEVLSKTKSRVSISGWFHGALQTKLVSKSMPFRSLEENQVETLEGLINPDYLTKAAMKNILNVFLDQSSIELQRFLQPAVYDQLLAEMASSSAEDKKMSIWDEQVGPRHVRCYSRASGKPSSPPIPPTMARLQRLLTSRVFTDYLRKITNLGLLSVFSELRMFEKGDYTLLHDHALERTGLDVVFSMPDFGPGQQEWSESWGGGATHYVSDKTTLLTLLPRHNTLSVVLRDEGTLRFVRYLNYRVKSAKRRELSLLYTIDEDDDEEEEEEEEEGEEDQEQDGKKPMDVDE